ncbi:MAG: hypothetical protein QOG62_1481 [Thermoleophilaceae bacterium]|jgi:prepilin-type processing-associated H-X9-DG protein|nr:hypothetical protein [Thermoleophilaceae bacterium]
MTKRQNANSALAAGLLALTVGAGGCGGGATTPPAEALPVFSDPTNITNPWLPISQMKTSVFEGTEDGDQVRNVKKLLTRTESFTVGGQAVEAAVVEDRAYVNGELHEVADDFYAQADDGTVHYMGEDVDYYENGKVTGHEGAFRYGDQTQHLGVAMPADPKAGDEFSIEDVPGVGNERNTVAEIQPHARVGGRGYSNVLAIDGHVEPDNEDEVKYYVRGIGTIRESGPKSDEQLQSR